MITEIMLSLSAVFAIVGALGFFRFPDFYTRTHAATMVTIGGTCLALAAEIYATYTSASLGIEYPVKIALIIIFIIITNPTGTHALASSAYRAGIKPKRLAKNDMEK